MDLRARCVGVLGVGAAVLAAMACGARTDLDVEGPHDAGAPREASAVDVAEEPDAGAVRDAREDEAARDAAEEVRDANEEEGHVVFTYPCLRYGGVCLQATSDGGCPMGAPLALAGLGIYSCPLAGQVCCSP